MPGEDYDDAIQEPILLVMPGGRELIDFYGRVPWFHDDEIERLELLSAGKSRLVVSSQIYGNHVETKACLVVFEIEEIVELKLEHFYRQNALLSLRFQPAGPLQSPPLYGAQPSPEDIEIEIEPAVGMAGVIRCRGVSVTFHELPERTATMRSGD